MQGGGQGGRGAGGGWSVGRLAWQGCSCWGPPCLTLCRAAMLVLADEEGGDGSSKRRPHGGGKGR